MNSAPGVPTPEDPEDGYGREPRDREQPRQRREPGIFCGHLISLRRSSKLLGSLPDKPSSNISAYQPTRWKEIQVPPPPTMAPSASSTGVWRPSASLAQNTGGRSTKAGRPHAPKT